DHLFAGKLGALPLIQSIVEGQVTVKEPGLILSVRDAPSAKLMEAVTAPVSVTLCMSAEASVMLMVEPVATPSLDPVPSVLLVSVCVAVVPTRSPSGAVLLVPQSVPVETGMPSGG